MTPICRRGSGASRQPRPVLQVGAALATIVTPALSRTVGAGGSRSAQAADPSANAHTASLGMVFGGKVVYPLRLSPPIMIRRLFLLATVLALLPAPALAQRNYGYGNGYGRGGYYADLPEGIQGDGAGFSFCRLAYRSNRREAGGQGWTTDYPNADRNFMFRTEELTTVQMSHYPNGEWAHSIVTLTHKDLYRCPFLFAEDVGTMSLNDEEVAAFQKFFVKGGALWVDDFWGSEAWAQWEYQLRSILPGKEWVELSADDPLFKTLYHIKKIPQIPSIMHWRRSGGGTSERGFDSAEPHMRAIYDEKGRMQVLASFDTDIADGWEREGEDHEYFFLFSPDAYAIGTNVIVWMMTH